MIHRVAIVIWMVVWAGGVRAGAVLELCFNYGCAQTVGIFFSDQDLSAVEAHFAGVSDAASEREVIAEAVGTFYRIAGGQSPILADRGGNYLDEGVEGRMDCIDHSTTTTRFLELMSAQGWLRHHVVLEPSRRARFIFQHFSARLEERPAVPAGVSQDMSDRLAAHHGARRRMCDCASGLSGQFSALAAFEPGQLKSNDSTAQFVVDSWFGDHAQPAVIMPLANWLNGEGPDVQ